MGMVEIIQGLCKNAGTSLNALEKELGFGKGTIYRWNDRIPSVDKVKKVADHFDVSIDYISGRKPSDDVIEPFPSNRDDSDQNQRLILLARHLEEIPETDRKRVLDNFESTIDLYLTAKRGDKG